MNSPAAAPEFERAYRQFVWQPWQFKSGEFHALKKRRIPCRPGVYIIRAPKPLNRVRGSSDVVYVGQAGGGTRRGEQGIGSGNGNCGRLFNTRGSDAMIRDRIEELFPGAQFLLECAFIEKDDPKKIEAKLLRAYLADHCELPPSNHQNPEHIADAS
jgi:hypothetical protein